MIADSGTACVTRSIEWEGVLVGALDCAVNKHSLCVGYIKSGCSDSKPPSSNPPRWGRLGFGIGSDLSLPLPAWQVYGPVMCRLQPERPVARHPSGITIPDPKMCRDHDPRPQKTARIHWDPTQNRHDPGILGLLCCSIRDFCSLAVKVLDTDCRSGASPS